jgi:hypothetical protein
MVTIFFMTLINCDLNMYSHISYKLLQDCDYKKKKLTNNPFMLEYKCANCLNYLCGLI